MKERLSASACVFDVYGTLFDVHSALRRERGDLDEKTAASASEMWRRKQLEYTWLRSLMRRHADFAQVTADALDYAMEAHGVADDRLREAWLRAYRRLDPYPEAEGVLRRLREAGVVCAILSNGTPEMLAAVLDDAGWGGLFSCVLSVQEVGVFKPDPSVYALATERLGVEASQTAFLSSNAWDAAGAACFGFQAIWVNRAGAPAERLSHAPRAQMPNLEALPAALGL